MTDFLGHVASHADPGAAAESEIEKNERSISTNTSSKKSSYTRTERQSKHQTMPNPPHPNHAPDTARGATNTQQYGSELDNPSNKQKPKVIEAALVCTRPQAWPSCMKPSQAFGSTGEPGMPSFVSTAVA